MTTAIRRARRLGKLPAREDPRTLDLGRYTDRSRLPAPPPELDLTRHVRSWPLYANDRVGDCAVAAAAHMVAAWTAAARGAPYRVSERSVLAAFARVRVVDERGEDAAAALDVLRDWRTHGIGRHRIAAFARLSFEDPQLVRTAAWLFGGVYVGLRLPLTAQRQDVWRWTGSLAGDAAPGSWGGHAVNLVRYGPGTAAVVSWDEVVEVTWDFLARYCDEAYCVLSRDFLADGRAPNGLDLGSLRNDLALVTA